MGRTVLGAAAGVTAAFLWFFVLYGVWFFVPVESPPAPVEFITKWFPLTIVLPSLVLAGVGATLVARSNWAIASAVCGLVTVLLFLWFVQATGMAWVLLVQIAIGVGLALLSGYVTRLFARHA
jgi:hypothetical protein